MHSFSQNSSVKSQCCEVQKHPPIVELLPTVGYDSAFGRSDASNPAKYAAAPTLSDPPHPLAARIILSEILDAME